MREPKNLDIEKSKSLIQIFNDVYRKSSTHLYLEKSINKKLTNEVIQALGEKYSEFNGSTQESIIKELLEEFDTELAQIPPVAFLIQLVEEIDQEITKIQKQNDENLTDTRNIKSKIGEINNTLESNTEILNQLNQRVDNFGTIVSSFQVQLQGLSDQVTERVKGGLSDQLSTIRGLELKVDHIDQKIPTHLISKRDFWSGIATIGGLMVSAFGVLAFVWIMLNSLIDRIEKGTSDKIDMNNENNEKIINEKTRNLQNDLNNSHQILDQRLNQIENKLD